MLQQDLDTDGDEDQPAHQFCAGLIPGAEYIADLDADHGQKKCHSTDETDGGDNVDLQESEGDAYCESIYAAVSYTHLDVYKRQRECSLEEVLPFGFTKEELQ